MKSESGQFGERCAAGFFERKGGRLLDRNHRSRYGEIDLIVELDGFLVFAEVKTRAKNTIAAPREWVDKRKQQKIIQTAMLYLAEHPTALQPRFDVVEVITPTKDILSPCEIYHIMNAFEGGLY